MDHDPLTSDRGASTAMLLAVFAALMLLVAAALTLIQIHVAASRAAAAADLAALSAADTARGLMIGDPCTVAENTVTAHEATMTQCDLAAPGVAHIRVAVDVPLGFTATAESRAGPKQP